VLDKSHFSEAIASTNISFCYLPLYFMIMKRKVTKRGHVSVPSGVRRQLHIGPNAPLERIVERDTARVIPVPADPAKAFRGSGKKGLAKQLLKDRRRDRQKENSSQK
jgi:bifunctional DNA-binding transcriptional regulator/antitoxin component of YhaV-PrlF toxin-antitoxin module